MDIVEWLRELKMSANNADWNAIVVNNRLEEAANKIEQLRELMDEAENIALAYYITLMSIGESETASSIREIAKKFEDAQK